MLLRFCLTRDTAYTFKASLYSERQQTYLLIGEVVETAKEVVLKSSLPYFAGAVAARCLIVLANPLHPLYAKVNKFLNRRPQWELAKLPSYWVDKILLNPPVDDDGHYQEVEWLLEVLTDGLRTPSVSLDYTIHENPSNL